MEKLAADVISRRRRAIPGSGGNEKQQREMEVPVWLLSMIYKCLEKDPAKRFRNGSALQEFIHLGTITEERKKGISSSAGETAKALVDESILRKEILTLQTNIAEKEELLKDLQYQVDTRDRELIEEQYRNATKRKGV